MKTEETKHINIVSYYSEVDTVHDCFNGIDNIYSIYFPVDMDIKAEIERAYEELQNKELYELTNELSNVLDYLIKEGKKIDYEVLDYTKFDCDYGTFDKE